MGLRFDSRTFLDSAGGWAGWMRALTERVFVTQRNKPTQACARVGIGGRMPSRRVTYMGYGACALAGCLWGTGFYFGRLALNEMSVEYMVLYRFLFASLGVLPIALTQRVRLTRSEVGILLTSTAFGIPDVYKRQLDCQSEIGAQNRLNL